MAFILRLLRIAVYATFSWLVLAALWLGLPSPSREHYSQPGQYALNTLRSGRPLVRIYDSLARSRDGYHLNPLKQESRSSFALTYKLEQKRNTTLLTLADGLTVDLSPEYVTTYPFLSQQKFTIVKTGDQDGINPPWFSKADSTLLFWWIHRDSAQLTLVVRWRDANNIELWPTEALLGAFDDTDDTSPFIRLRFETPPGKQGNQLMLLNDVVLPRQSSSPSSTYAMRVMILGLIAPTGLLVIGIMTMLGPILSTFWQIAIFIAECMGFYCALVAFIWIVRGRRPIAEDAFVSKFPGTELFGGHGASRLAKREKRMVWGPSGPIEVDDDTGSIRRKPIRNLGDFFRSSAPLDDLLASFDSTRRFTEPLLRNGRYQSRGDPIMVRNESEVRFERHRKAYSEDGLEESGLIDLEKALPEKPGVALQR